MKIPANAGPLLPLRVALLLGFGACGSFEAESWSGRAGGAAKTAASDTTQCLTVFLASGQRSPELGPPLLTDAPSA